ISHTKETGGIGAVSGAECAPSGASPAQQGFTSVSANGDRSTHFYSAGLEVTPAVTASGAHPAFSLYVGVNNLAGTPDSTNYTNRYLRAYSFGTGLSASDVAN